MVLVWVLVKLPSHMLLEIQTMPVRHEHGDDCVPCVTYRSVRAVVSSSDNEVLLFPQTSADCTAGCPASLESSAAAAAHDQKASILACYVCKWVAGKLCNDTRAIRASNGKMCDFWTHFVCHRWCRIVWLSRNFTGTAAHSVALLTEPNESMSCEIIRGAW